MNPTLQRIIMAPVGLPKQGLVACYKFQEQAGSQVLTDYSGYGNHGVNGSDVGVDTNDVTFNGVKGAFGADDYVVMPLLLAGLSSFTVIFVPNYAAGTVYRTVYSERSWTSATPIRALIDFSDTGKLRFLVRDDAGATFNCLTTDAYSDDFAMYSAIRNGKTGHIYKGTTQLVTAAAATSPGAITCEKATIGASIFNSTVGSYLNGSMYWFLVYNYALSTSTLARVQRFLKSDMAKRGVSLSV